MSNTQLLAAEPASATRPVATPARRTVLLATDASPASEPALRIAHALAEGGADVHALYVVDSRSVPIPPPLDVAVALADAAYGEAFRTEREAELRNTLSQVLGRTVDWPLAVALGTPARAIRHEAAQLHADLVIVGLRRHNVIERIAEDGTALDVMRTAPCPVLGVAASLSRMPKRVLAAVDFSRASLEAARAADRLVGQEGTLILAYVPPTLTDVLEDGARVIHELGVKAAFEWFKRELRRDDPRSVQEVLLPRSPTQSVAGALFAYADTASIDLIALGSARHGRVERWILGSVTTDVARDGRRSVLVVPPHDPGA